MTATDRPSFVYVTYIRATPEAVWRALTDPDFTERFWFGRRLESDWKVGSPVRLSFEGEQTDSGEVLEADPPRRLSFSWLVLHSGLDAEGHARASFDLSAEDGVVKLVLTHDRLQPGGRVIEAISGGWPKVLANLKTLLETGEALDMRTPRAPAEKKA